MRQHVQAQSQLWCWRWTRRAFLSHLCVLYFQYMFLYIYTYVYTGTYSSKHYLQAILCKNAVQRGNAGNSRISCTQGRLSRKPLWCLMAYPMIIIYILCIHTYAYIMKNKYHIYIHIQTPVGTNRSPPGSAVRHRANFFDEAHARRA